MSAQIVLSPVFVLAIVSLALRFWTARTRTEGDRRDGGAGGAGPFDLQLLFYVLIALALPLRHADLVIVLLSWVFVVTSFLDAGYLRIERRSAFLAGTASALVLLAMWIYFALRILLLI